LDSKRFDIVIVGAGIIGLATAMTLIRSKPRLHVAVLDKEADLGLHQTAHNSGVIHAGIYYTEGSKKANLCSTGGRMLRRYCDDHGIEYVNCGKVIVAVNESEIPVLEELKRRGIENGATGLESIDAKRLRELEPHAAGLKAIYSPNTGIVDYGQVARALATEVRDGGGELLLGTKVVGTATDNRSLRLETSQGEIVTRGVINCAGLHADVIARLMSVETGVRIIPFRGEFFTLRPERTDLIQGLIYPVPNPRLPFLGVHFTRRTNGTVEAGPNAVLALAREGYRKSDIDIAEIMGIIRYGGFWRMSMTYWKAGIAEEIRSFWKETFVRSLQKLVPEIRKRDLQSATAGVRAQAVDTKGRLLQDFSIVSTRNSIHVLNAPSPAATACLAIGRHIEALASEAFDLRA